MKKPASSPPAQKPAKPFFRPFESVAKKALENTAKPATTASREVKKQEPPKPAKSPVHRNGDSAKAAEREPSFAEMMWGVKRTDRGPRAEPSIDKSAPSSVQAKRAEDADAEAVREHLRALVQGGNARFEIADDGLKIEGRRIDLDPKILRRLRRGELTIDARCDLHGLGVYEARAKMETFVQTCRARGERVLLLVHGKGTHSPGGLGVLRGEMAAWLSQGPASVHVVAFTSALPDDGGDGALYVLVAK